jgi:[ribosomal protein S18]-alanine N-acetyltransferase
MVPVIRRYRDSDFSGVCVLERENSPGDCKPEVFVRQASVLYAETFIVAEESGAILGYTVGALVQHRPIDAWIIRLAVAETHRRQGVGEMLAMRVLDALQECGAREVWLSVSPSNHPAHALYEKHGFFPAGFSPAYFGEGADRYLLCRRFPDM